MKKLIALTLVLLMVAGCSAPSLKLGLGMVANMSGGDASADGDGKTQADVTACAVTLDSNGKIVGVAWDVMQCKASVTTAGAVTVADSIQSKKELAENVLGGGGEKWLTELSNDELLSMLRLDG